MGLGVVALRDLIGALRFLQGGLLTVLEEDFGACEDFGLLDIHWAEFVGAFSFEPHILLRIDAVIKRIVVVVVDGVIVVLNFQLLFDFFHFLGCSQLQAFLAVLSGLRVA